MLADGSEVYSRTSGEFQADHDREQKCEDT